MPKRTRESVSIWSHPIAVAAVILLALPMSLGAQEITAFKTGEKTTGMTKQCFYDALGSEHTRTLKSIELCPLSIRVRNSARSTPPSQPSEPARPRTITAFKTGEQTTNMTKQCYYKALGSEYTQTVRSIELCPLSIQVKNGPG